MTVFDFKPETTYEGIGHCLFVSDDFCTFVHSTPCSASIANLMYMNGYVIYVQPIKMNHLPLDFNKDGSKYVVTYKRRDIHG